MIKRFCDICGKEFKKDDTEEHFKVKQLKEYSYPVYENGYVFCDTFKKWERLDVHRVCWLQICMFIKHKFDPAVELVPKPVDKHTNGVEENNNE